MDNCVETVISDSVVVEFSDSLSDLSTADSSDESENSSLIRNKQNNENDLICRRLSNYMDGSRKVVNDCDDIQFYTTSSITSQSMRQSPNKSFKRFLFLFSFLSTIITISLYLSMYYDEPTLQGESQKSKFRLLSRFYLNGTDKKCRNLKFKLTI